MMAAYFIAGLIASAALIFALFKLLLYLLRNNWNHSNKSRLSYLAPVVIVIIITFLSLTEFVPRAFDLVRLVDQRYSVMEIDLQTLQKGRSSLIINDQSYFFAPGTFKPDSEGRYQIMFTPMTRFIIHVTNLGDTLGK
ncbi:MAG: hypothetical protein GX850_03485 [Clostridiaceae bacterium]|nr:hypothetical protein [Clostridiaceae bacterium]